MLFDRIKHHISRLETILQLTQEHSFLEERRLALESFETLDFKDTLFL